MNISIKEENDSIVANLNGRLDTAAAAEVANDFKSLQDNADKEIILDCSGLDYISSSGLRLFISLRKVSAAKGGNVVIQHINDNVRNVFTMTGFYRLFTIKD
jgi:anti-sigma B factor antagonist